MYAKLAASYDTGTGKDRDKEVLVLANPGIPLTEADLKDGYTVSTLVDDLPKISRSYQRIGQKVSKVYEQILTAAQTSKFEKQADRDKVLNAYRQLWDKT